MLSAEDLAWKDSKERYALETEREIEQERTAKAIALVDTIDALIAGLSGLTLVSRSNPRIFSYCSLMSSRALAARSIAEDLTR